MTKQIAIIVGTGAEGSGLAARFARAGARVFIGSRNADKAVDAAQQIQQRAAAGEVTGHTNADAAALAPVVMLTLPLAAHAQILKSIRGRLLSQAILVDATLPPEIAIGGRLSRVITLWVAQQAARLVPTGILVIAAFHSLSADILSSLDDNVDCDALICGDSPEAKRTISELAQLIPGVRAVDAGPLENARYLEVSAAMLVALNLHHKVKHAGMRITGLLDRDKRGRRE